MSDALSLPLSRRGRRPGLLVGGMLGAPALIAGGLLLIAAITSTSLCTGAAQLLGGLRQTGNLMTPEVMRAINEQSARFEVDPYVVGALAMRETAGGARVSCSSAGACGVMQLMPTFWAASRCDGDGDGRMDIADVDDNVCAAITGLIHQKHTLVTGRRMTRAEIAAMARSYCGSCTDRACGGGVDGGYCQGVLRNFRRLGGTFADATSAATLTAIPAAPGTGGCTALAAQAPATGVSGWSLAAGANLPGRPLSPLFTAFMNQVAPLLTYPPVLTTGTNHSQYTVDGNVSDHYAGNAGDFGAAANHFDTDDAQPGQPVPGGDELAAAMFIAAGTDPAQARAWALAGGLRNVDFTFQGRPVRLQVIWKTSEGGNHHDHVHGGIRPA